MPRTDAQGCPFGGPGVDLRGDDARAIIAAAAPVVRWLDEREPGVRVRSISIRVSPPRALVSCASITPSDPRPRALRFEPPFAEELRAAARGAEALIEEACRRALARRTARQDDPSRDDTI